MSKSTIKSDVIRKQFAPAIRAIRKTAIESKSNCVPQPEPDDPQQTLDNVRYVVEDTNIRLHAWTNIERGGAGWYVTKVPGETLAQYLLAPVRRAFEHPRIHTFIMNMDKGLFMPPPKIYTQKNRTKNTLEEMQKKQIAPLQFDADGRVPLMIAEGKNVPPWLAVCANRIFFRHASFQLILLIAKLYKPPPGRRLIIDALDMNATSPATLDEWMVSELIELDDFAKEMVERTRATLKQLGADKNDHHYDDELNNWRAQTMLVGKELAQAGHIKAIPFCIETTDDGVTYPPFMLPNAKNNCGEADVGILRWIEMMQANRQHITLEARRPKATLIDPSLAEWYTAEQLEINAKQSAALGANPLSVAERRTAAQQALAKNPDAPFRLQIPSVRAAVAEGLPRLETNPCKEPNRALILSIDTDFLSLLPLFYARMCFHERNDQYCYDNAPLLSIGECNVLRTGWLVSGDDFYKAPAKKRKRGGDDNDEDEQASDDEQAALQEIDANRQAAAMVAHEVYDIHMFYTLLVRLGQCDDDAAERLNCVISFALFCAACKNDYMKGNYGVNRKHQFEAFVHTHCRLAVYHPAMALPVILPTQYQSYIKYCYYVSIRAKKGGEKWLPKDAVQMTNAEMRAITLRKYKGTGERSVSSRMPDDERRQLMLERLQWWLVYAFCSWQDIAPVLDHTAWGWNAATTHLMV